MEALQKPVATKRLRHAGAETNLDSWREFVAPISKNGITNETVARNKAESHHWRVSEQKCEGTRNLRSAYEKNVPVSVPGFTDSEMGLDFACTIGKRQKEGRPLLRYDPFEDLNVLRAHTPEAETAGDSRSAEGWRATGRRNLALTANSGARGGEDIPLKRYRLRSGIGPEPVQWGGLWAVHIRSCSMGKVCSTRRKRKVRRSLADATWACR